MSDKPQSRMSSPTSIWLRAMRYLTHEGKTLPQLSPIMVKTDEPLMPFAIMTQTDNNRLICWPVLPKDSPLESEKGRLIDHITLELSNGKTHTTAFDPEGKRHHKKAGGKLKELPGTGLAPWFCIYVRWNVIIGQDLRVSTQMLTPDGDGPRREQVFRKMAEDFKSQHVVLPDGPRLGDYICCMLCVQVGHSRNIGPIANNLLGPKADDIVSGCPDQSIFPVIGVPITVGTTKLVSVAAAPPGTLKSDVIFAFMSPNEVTGPADHCKVLE